MKRVVILYSEVGGGHKSIAEGIQDRLEARHKDVLIECVNIFGPASGSLYKTVVGISDDLFDFSQRFWEKESMPKFLEIVRGFADNSKIRKIINNKPDLIVSVHYLASFAMKSVLKKYWHRPPLVDFIADPFTPHILAFRTDADMFLGYDEKFFTTKMKKYLKGKFISVGWPVRKEFLSEQKFADSHAELNDRKLAVTFGGSGLGMDSLEKLIFQFLRAKIKLRGNFLCGSDRVLKSLLKIVTRSRKEIQVFGSLTASEMAGVFQTSDFLVGKAGPNMMFEAISCGLPMIATPPILTQEKGNRKFIKDNDLGFLSKTPKETMMMLEKIINNPNVLLKKKENVARVRNDLMALDGDGWEKFDQWLRVKVLEK